MEKTNTRQTIAFVAVALVIMLAYQFFILRPAQHKQELAQRAAAAQVKEIGRAHV